MVRGLDKFKEYFEQYSGNYIIIGGTACDIIIDEAGFTPRATKDIDIILVVEVLSADFIKQFWKFIQDGSYQHKEKSADERKYYRFMKPESEEFPYQIELFSRNPDLIELDELAHLTPIPVDDDLSSLSAILLSDDYYNFVIEHSKLDNGAHIAQTEALICLKAIAFLDMTKRKANGETFDEKDIRKHKTDVFRLAVMLAEADIFDVPESIKNDLQAFVDTIVNDLPDEDIYKRMGLGYMNIKRVFNQLIKSFKLIPGSKK
jgi:hypothetical protein